MKSSFCIDLQRFMLIPTKFPLSHKLQYHLSGTKSGTEILVLSNYIACRIQLYFLKSTLTVNYL